MFERMLRRDQRLRIIDGRLEPGDVAAVRRFVQLTQEQFAEALGISVSTLQNDFDGGHMIGAQLAAKRPRPQPSDLG